MTQPETALRLPFHFIWSSSGREHVEYKKRESTEGEVGTYLGMDDLGSGRQASVTLVIVKKKPLVRKRMHFIGVNEEYRREARILEGIIHRHIIQLVGTYTLNRRLYLHLYPVAESTLKEYIITPIEDQDKSWKKHMTQGFGCLVRTVAFLHSKQIAIKHKDIKPSNMLMQDVKPILTDFGISNCFMGRENATSSGFMAKSTLYAVRLQRLSLTRKETYHRTHFRSVLFF